MWEEVSQNKKLNKFNHSIIDEQFQFYQREGLPRFNKSDPNRYLPSRKSSNQLMFLIYLIMSCYLSLQDMTFHSNSSYLESFSLLGFSQNIIQAFISTYAVFIGILTEFSN